MPRPRTPLAKAEATGRTIHDPQRYRDRKEPDSTPLGGPSQMLQLNELKAWEIHKQQFPYMKERDRGAAVVGAMLLARLMGGCRELKVQLAYLAWCREMGGTPASASKVHVPESSDSDPADEFLVN